jgi:hypothetical protein
MYKNRPFGVTLLAILAGLAAVVAIFHTLQMLHLLPLSLGPLRFFTFNLLGAILWGIMALIYIWLVRMLWSVNPQAWMFLVILAIINLILDFVSWLGGSPWAAMLPSVLINAVILIYCLLPGVRKEFGTEAK